MLIQIREADRLALTARPEWKAYNPFGIAVKAGDLSTRHDRAEYIYNVYGSWRRSYTR